MGGGGGSKIFFRGGRRVDGKRVAIKEKLCQSNGNMFININIREMDLADDLHLKESGTCILANNSQ